MERERLEAEILQVLAARDGDGGKYFVAALPDYIKKAVGPISHPAPGARSQSAVVTDQEISAALCVTGHPKPATSEHLKSGHFG